MFLHLWLGWHILLGLKIVGPHHELNHFIFVISFSETKVIRRNAHQECRCKADINGKPRRRPHAKPMKTHGRPGSNTPHGAFSSTPSVWRLLYVFSYTKCFGKIPCPCSRLWRRSRRTSGARGCHGGECCCCCDDEKTTTQRRKLLRHNGVTARSEICLYTCNAWTLFLSSSSRTDTSCRDGQTFWRALDHDGTETKGGESNKGDNTYIHSLSLHQSSP